MDDAHIPDLDTLSYSGAFATAQIPNLGASKTTSGTFNANRIPILPTNRYGSAVLLDGSREMQGDLSMGSHAIRGISELEFYGTYDLALTPVHKDILQLVDRSYGTYKSLALAGLYVYTGIDMNDCEIGNLSTAPPTTNYQAVPKKYVDDHNWSAGDITTGTFNANRIPILPTNRYGSAVLLDGSREMQGDLSMGSHAIRGISELEYYGTYDIALTPSHRDIMDLVNRDNTLYKSLELAGVYVHAGIDMNDTEIGNLSTALPTTDYQAVPKKYVDDEIASIGAFNCADLGSCDIGDLGTGGVMQGDLLMGNHAIEDLDILKFHGFDAAIDALADNLVGLSNKAKTQIISLRLAYLESLTGISVGDGYMIQTDKVRARDGDGLALYEDGGAGIFIKDGGNVGIGSTSPESKLDIGERMKIWYLNRTITNAAGNGAYATLGYFAIGSYQSLVLEIALGTSGSGTNRYVLNLAYYNRQEDSTWRICSPSNMVRWANSNITYLEVRNTGSQLWFRIRRATNAQFDMIHKVVFRVFPYTDGLSFTEDSGTGTDTGSLATSAMSTPVTMLDSGNVGIGTMTPGAKLDVNGDAKLGGDLNMGTHTIKNVTVPTTDYQAAPKKYVDDQDEFLLPLSGTRGMTGDLDMNNHIITEAAHDLGDLDNQEYRGFVLTTQIAGESLSFGNLVYHASDNRYNKTDADTISKTEGDLAIVLTTGATAENGYVTILKLGSVKNTSWSFTIGTILYISQTAGVITATEPSAVGSFSRKIGYAQAANIVYFDPSHTILENG